ncbi:ABC transporter ATP-binding protein [uncultured Microbacterium sp.]|uniref:Putative peptide transport fused subunits of ABC superfamily: ATP-binding components n=1 Tax=uncultured Microbacterium sp. TaxID=191216 RepID=A0A1Y5P3P0_9MICO|nr:ABC transporter ATP-binding protein [uncultured Microbacterium sp.]SBS73267.1 putative peptide transport fused subunits of ABC superfamily: ATP-binding components [uncultured Microbacterium sp.]
MSSSPLLRVRDLRIAYTSRGITREAVHGVSFDIAQGDVVAIVGESGSGKTTVAQSLIGMLAHNGAITGGSITFDGMDVTRFGDRAWRGLRGDAIGLVPQDPTVSLNPVMRIGPQVAEPLRIHQGLSKSDAAREAVRILRDAGLTDPEQRAEQYPHQLSGGMRQRVLIGMALACTPRFVIADEPTSALDVTVQRQILNHIDDMIAVHSTAMLLITHDLAVAAERAQRVIVMCQGEIVEHGPSDEIMSNPQHPYTKKLLAAAPSLSTPSVRLAPPRLDDADADDRVVRLENVTKQFALPGGGTLTAVDDVSLDIRRGETLGLVGESGSGKSTLARIVLQLEKQTSGEVRIDGQAMSGLKAGELRALRRRMQVVYQNPYASLDPRYTVASIIEEPLRAFRVGGRREQRARALELLDRVALPAHTAGRRAEELSGGMRQRVAIARALALSPELLVCDEPTSALDVSVQAQVLELLTELQHDLGVTILFISHDLAVVRQLSHRVAVMQFGVLREVGDVEQVFTAPAHAYTRELLAAIPGKELVA